MIYEVLYIYIYRIVRRKHLFQQKKEKKTRKDRRKIRRLLDYSSFFRSNGIIAATNEPPIGRPQKSDFHFSNVKTK